MRRHLQILTVLTVVATPCGFAQAQTLTAAKIDNVNKAADSFVTLAKDSNTTGKAPRYSDPAAKPLLDTALDTKDIQGGKPLPWSSIQLLQDWHRAMLKIGVVYYLAGTGAKDVDAVNADPQKVIKANSNTAAFAPEFARYYDAQIRIYSAMVNTAAAQLAAATDEQKKDASFRTTLGNISAGTATAITGVLSSFTHPNVSDDWQLLRTVVLLDITPKAARFLAPQDREAVKNTAAAIADQIKNPDVKSGVNAIARGFALL